MNHLILFLTAAQSAATLGFVQPTRRHHLGNGCPSRRLAERADGDTSPRFAGTALPEWLTAPVGLNKRATTCINGNNFCFKDPTQACRQCGSCCANGRCATNFGSCCPGDSNICAYGFTCCASDDGPSKCCYAGTSFCCPTANGCCMNGQTCGKNGCEGTAAFVVQSVTTTTTLYTTDFTTTTTTTSTSFTTFSITYIQLLTTNVTSSGAATATSTVYVKSTRFVKRTAPELAIPTAAPAAVRARGPEAPSESLALTAAPASPVSAAIHDGLAAVGLLQKRAVTSFIYTYIFIWVGVPGTATITKLMVVPATNVATSTSTATNTVFSDAKVTVTVTSTITIDVEAAATMMSKALESTMQARVASDRMKPPDPTATITGAGPAMGAGAAATGAPGGDGLDSVSQGTGPATDNSGGGGGGSSGGMMGNGTTDSTPPTEPLPELGATAKAWIGAGAAVAGLAVLGLALLLTFKRRDNDPDGRNPLMRMVFKSPKLTRIEAGPPFETGSSIFENVRTWTPPMPAPPPPPPHTPPPAARPPLPVPPHQQPTPPHANSLRIWPPWLADAAAGDAAAAAAAAATTTATATLGSHVRHISDGSATVRQSAYSVSDYGPSYEPSMASPAAATATAGLPPADMGHLGLRRWTVEMDSTESLRESERTFGAGPVYDPARYMEMGARDSPSRSRELLEVAGPPGAVLGSCRR